MPARPAATDRDPTLADLLAEVRRIEVQSQRLATDVMSGGYVSAFRGAGLEVAEVREYVEGDDPRAVDWGVTARMGRPFVRKYVEERERTLVFLLDLSASMTGGFGVWSARQTAARVCACLALSATRTGDRVGLLAFGGGEQTYVRPERGMRHALRIVRDVLALPAREGGTDLVPPLEFVARAVRRGAVVFLVSDFLAGGWERALSIAARRHDVVAVRLLLPEEEVPSAGLFRLEDPETGETSLVDAHAPAVRAVWARRVEGWRRSTEAALRRAGVDLMDVPVPRAPGKDLVAGPILRFFRLRELRGAKR